jgi:hypothetical protein
MAGFGAVIGIFGQKMREGRTVGKAYMRYMTQYCVVILVDEDYDQTPGIAVPQCGQVPWGVIVTA